MLVNVGDLLQIFSNGVFPATLHRVVIPKEEKEQRPDICKLKKCQRSNPRQSIVFFLHPDGETQCKPLRGDLKDEDINYYKSVTAMEHVKRRFLETFQK